MTTRGLCGIALVAVATAVALKPAPSLTAEQAAPTRNVAGKFDLAGVADRESVMVWVDFAPGATETKHTHDADVFAFVVDGSVTFEADGIPVTTLKPGGTWHLSPRVVHLAKNASATAPAKLAVVFVAEKGKPLTTPAK